MKETKKLDIILRGLYEYRGSDSNIAPHYFLNDLTLQDEIRLARWLLDEGLVKGTITQDGARLKITSDGVIYCEDDSVSHPGSPVIAITYVQNFDSPGSTIQVGVIGQLMYPNILDIQQQINGLRSQLAAESDFTQTMVSEIGECLDEIASKVEDRKPVPEFYWKWLGRIADGTSLVGGAELLRQSIHQ